MSLDTERTERIVRCLRDNGELINLGDGFVYYYPTGMHGALTASNLRTIADELDRMNKDWKEQIEKDLGPKEANNGNENSEADATDHKAFPDPDLRT